MESKTDKPAPKDDNDSLKTLPMPELQKKLGSSPDGLSQAEADETADAIRAQRDHREEDQSAPKVSLLFLGAHSVDD